MLYGVKRYLSAEGGMSYAIANNARRGAIETVYKGIRFRSRLEARWAVFFDEIGVDCLYEHEGYEVDGFRYLPDFYFPQLGYFAEVKGDASALARDAERLTAILDFGSPMPGINESDTTGIGGLILLGELPYVQWGAVIHPVITHHKGLLRRWGRFFATAAGAGFVRQNDCDLDWIEAITGEGHIQNHELWNPKSVFVPLRLAQKQVIEAYQTARQARFEWGA